MKTEAYNQSALSSAILQDTNQIVSFRAEANSTEQARRKAQLLEWLSNHDHIKEQQDNISRHKEGTGMWLLHEPKFKEWESGALDTLFCVGMPGAGKTVMSAMVVRHLFQTPQVSSDKVAVAFLYFRHDLRETQSTERLLGSLIRQLVSQLVEAPYSIEQGFKRIEKGRCVPPSREMLQDAVGCFSCVYFVIDALDEGTLQQTKGLISTIRCLRKARVKLFTTSRFIPEIQAQFEDNHSIEIRGSDVDIENYTTDRLGELPRCVQNNLPLRAEITQAIVASTQGMFLLAKLQIDSLKDKRTLKAMRSALGTLPSGSSAYDTAYDGALRRISDQSESDYELAQQVLTWLVYAMRPISEIDLETALAVELGERYLDPDNIVPAVELLSLCAGLVTWDKESKTVRLVHFTTQEYFYHNPQHLLRNPHRVLSNVCVSFLGIDDFKVACHEEDPGHKKLSSAIHRSTFLSYAAGYWEDHASAAQPSVNDDELSQRLALEVHLLRNKDLMESYLRARRRRVDDHRKDRELDLSNCGPRTGMQYVAAKGNLEHVSALLESGLDPNESTYGTTALFEAARGHHESVVRLLVETKADVNFQAKGSAHTPLTAAIDLHFARPNPLFLSSCHRDRPSSTMDPTPIVALLLEAGADPEHLPGNLDNVTPLMRACEYGMERVVNMLCETGVDVNRRGGNDLWGTGGRAALHIAASHGHESIVERLLQAGCDPDTADSLNRSPAICAAAGEHWTVLDMLLDTAAIDLHRETAYGDTILALACKGRSVPDALIRRLDFSRPDGINASDRPLIKAARAGKEIAVKMLLEAGADPQLTNLEGVTALHVAAGLGHDDDQHLSIAITKALLKAKMAVDYQVRDGSTALMLASRAGDSEMVKLLLDNGANVLLKDNRGWSVTTFAAVEGHADIVASLLCAGADPQTDLSFICAAASGHCNVLRVLIDSGVDTSTASEDGTTALVSAVKYGRLDAAKLLIESGAAVNAQTTDGKSPLMLSAAAGHKGLTRLLLDSGANVNLTNERGETALMVAIRTEIEKVRSAGLPEENQDVFRMLLEAGTDVNVSTPGGDTALLLATDVRYPRSDNVSMLLEAGAEASVAKRPQKITLASYGGIAKMSPLTLETLMKAGADPNEYDSNGLTALMRVSSSWGYSLDKLRVLLRYGAIPDIPNHKGQTVLMLAILDWHWSLCLTTVRELLNAGANPNHKDAAGRNALFYLALRSHDFNLSDVFRALVDAGGDTSAIAKDHETLLVYSVRLGDWALLKLLLAAGTDLQSSNKKGRNAIMLASRVGGKDAEEAVKLLLDAGVDPNQRDCRGHTALRIAATSSHSPTTLRMLLSAGMDPHERDANGLTLLMLVVSNNGDEQAIASEMVSALIGAGVEVDLQDNLGNTALMYAAKHNGPVRSLLKAGANPNVANTLGQTALMKCFSRTDVCVKRTLRPLMNAGADINMVDNNGRSVLILSASVKPRLGENVEAAGQILKIPGVCIDHTDNDGNTALMCAERVGNNRIADLIREHIRRRQTSVRTH